MSTVHGCNYLSNPQYWIPGLGNPIFYGDFPLDVCTHFCTNNDGCISSQYTCDYWDNIKFQTFNNTKCERYDNTILPIK